MSGPTLSIVTPSFNQADFIEECLQSVKNQNYDDVEHIVVDGGSSDDTVEILKEFENQYDLRWISEPDEGQSNAINKGIQMAEGDWIGWQNSDDYYHKGAFKHFHKASEKYPSADVIYGDVLVVDEKGEEQGRLLTTRPSLFQHKYWSMYARNQSSFFKSTTLKKVGGLNESLDFAMDAELFKKLLHSSSSFVHVSKIIGVFRDHEEAKTYGEFSENQEQEWEEIYSPDIIERNIPRPLLSIIGRGTKLFNVLRDRVINDIQYRLINT